MPKPCSEVAIPGRIFGIVTNLLAPLHDLSLSENVGYIPNEIAI